MSNSDKKFSTRLHDIKANVRMEMEKGAVTPSYKGDLEEAIRILNAALATEIVCVLRYKFHYFTAAGIHAKPVADEFLEHANEEQVHADQLAERICQLGGKPDFNPATLLQRSHADYREGSNLTDMIKENLIAERIAIESYREMIQFFGNDDPTTRRIIEGILAQEEEHADDMANILSTFEPHEEQTHSH